MRAMKDSGVEWIGDIPKEWVVIKLKTVGKICSGNNIKHNDLIYDGIYEIYGGNGLIGRCNQWNISGEKLIIGRVGALCGNIHYSSTRRFISDNALILSLNNNQCIKFYYYLLIAADLSKLNTSNAQPLITGTKVMNIKIPLIYIDEQQRIADYLDDRCAKIDTLISQEQTVIEKLKEYKQSMITQAVTKGLNPDVPMKDSGVDWIGDIPADWKISKIKYVAYFNPTVDKKLNNEDIVGYVPMDCLQCGYMLPKKIQVDKATSGLTAFLNGDIIMAKVTPCFENGEIAIAENLVNGMGLGSSELFIFRCFGINSKFLFYILQNSNLKHQCIATMTGVGGLKRVSPFFMKNSVIPLPPNDVQNKIVNGLNNLCSAIDATISKKQTLIDKLTEYKKSLIYEVVTGKKEV